MTRARARVLFVGAFPPAGHPIFGGMVTSCRALLASTLPARVELVLLDSTQISNPPPSLPVRLLLAAARCVRFVWLFERRRPEAVLLFVAVGASIIEKGAMAWYARLRGVPAMMFPRGGAIVDQCRTSAFTRTWARLAFRSARKIVCQGEAWRRFALDVLGFAAADVIVIRNWTATPELLEIGMRRVAQAERPVRLLFVGWLEREKGIFDLIEACHNVGMDRRYSLELAGEGHASAEARVLVARYGLTDVVSFRGWLREEGLRKALSEADVFVLPSWFEGLPNAMVEAMAAKLAVVVTRVGAIPDVIRDDSSGLLVEPRDVASLTRALAKVIDDAGLRMALAAEAHGIAQRDFSVEPAVDKLVQEIERLTQPARESRARGQVH